MLLNTTNSLLEKVTLLAAKNLGETNFRPLHGNPDRPMGWVNSLGSSSQEPAEPADVEALRVQVRDALGQAIGMPGAKGIT